MCEYIAQLNSASTYLGCIEHPLVPVDDIGSSDSAKSTKPSFLPPDLHDSACVIRPNHLLSAIVNNEDRLESVQVRWGWSPVWSMGTRPPLTHLPLEIAMRSKVFERMRNGGRALVAVDGWFDLAMQDMSTNKSRFTYMRPRSDEPVFLGAAQISETANGCNGLVLITLGGGGNAGPLQLLALNHEDALRWLDPSLDWQRAKEVASMKLDLEQAFEQVAVRQRVETPARHLP
jgi:putative SOS response-associated peptidase YedK